MTTRVAPKICAMAGAVLAGLLTGCASAPSGVPMADAAPVQVYAAGSLREALTDRGTWLNFKNRADLAVLVEGDTKLFNQYGVMVVNPAKHSHVKAQDAQKFVDWIVSPAGQSAIAGYKIGGEQLFFPNATQ